MRFHVAALGRGVRRARRRIRDWRGVRRRRVRIDGGRGRVDRRRRCRVGHWCLRGRAHRRRLAEITRQAVRALGRRDAFLPFRSRVAAAAPRGSSSPTQQH